MSSSEDDRPLIMNGNRTNGTTARGAKKNDQVKTEELPIHARGKRKTRKPAVKEEDSDSEPLPKGKRQKLVTNRSSKKDIAAEKKEIEKKAEATAKKLREQESQEKKASPSMKRKAKKVDSESDSDVPIKTKRAATTAAKNKANGVKKEETESDDEPLVKKAAPRKAPAKKPINVKKEDESDDEPLVKKAATKKAPAKKTNGVKKEEESDDEPLVKKVTPKKTAAKTPAKKVETKVEVKTPAAKGKGKAKKEESPVEDDEVNEDEEEEYRWWEQQENDGTTKWKTLEHNGVVFPPAYEPLPENVKLLYDGKPVDLPAEAEEVATFFGTMLNSTLHVENPRFTGNFFKDFRSTLEKHGGARNAAGKKIEIESFEKCDFRPIFDHYEAQRQERRNLTTAEKKAIKAEKDKQEEPYTYCYLDGRKEKVGNFRIEPPGLFRGRGEHPKTGMVKARVQPEQVTINIGKDAKVPEPPAGHQWADVVHDPTVTWLATWKENVNGNIKYVMLSATSSLKGMSDFKKFEKARELKKHIDRIRKDYRKELREKLMEVRQRATAMYLIDQFALRAGNEKGDEEADTVGCCSLRFEHVTLEPPNLVIFDFLGKDSIRFYNKFEVDPQVFKNLRIFKKEPKGHGDKLFDRVNTTDLNKHLQSYMPGLSAKVFRTYNASWTMQQELAKLENTGTVAEKILKYNAANRAVAILCNHQKTVSKAHESSVEKQDYKIKAMKYQVWRYKQMILALEPKRKRKDPAYFAQYPDLDDDWIKEHQKELVRLEREKIEKKFAKDNEKLVAEKEKPMGEKVLKDRLKELADMEKRHAKENKTGKVEAEGRTPSVEKFEANIKKLEERIEAAQMQMQDKEDNKTVALGTSKINYIDPRLTVMFCKKFGVPLEKVFPKTLREKFKWAIESADADWEF